MLSTLQNIAVVAVILAGSIAFLWVLQIVWPNDRRRPHNDLIGWQVTVLGTTYAVIVGFMLYTVWTEFQMADGNAEAEANCLVNLARSAEGFSIDQRLEVQNLALGYVDTMLADEWPAMNRLTFSPESRRIIQFESKLPDARRPFASNKERCDVADRPGRRPWEGAEPSQAAQDRS